MSTGINVTRFKGAMARVGKIISKQEALIKKLGNTESKPYERIAKEILELREKSTESIFRLLVMGCFSAGKSSFINVLLGEKLLPSKALPSTALITEICYGQTKKVVVHPYPGKWEAGDKPFEIAPSDMAKYCTINNLQNKKDGDKIETCFQKMVVYWPLQLLKDGIVIVDSPGLNDPYSHDTIVKDYIPKADAIIYCVLGLAPYNEKDQLELETLNAMGFKTPIFVTTYYDHVRKTSTSPELQEYVNSLNSHYSQYTSLGSEGCHYVDSIDGLEAKRNNEHSKLVNSGYFELEKYLSAYLAENKGRDQIAAVTQGTANLNKKALQLAKEILTTADQPIEEVLARLSQAEEKIEAAKQQGDLIVREFKIAMRDVVIASKPLIQKMVGSLAGKINLDNFKPSTTFKLSQPNKSAEAIAGECCEEIKRQNRTFIAQWTNETLVPRLNNEISAITDRMEDSFNRFLKDLHDIEIVFTGQQTDPPTVKTAPGTVSRVASFALTLLTGDVVSGLIGGTLGFGVLSKTLAYQFIAGIILGIIALFTPVGLPAVIIAAIIADLFALKSHAGSASDKIKNKVASEYKKHFNSPEIKEELVNSVLATLNEQIGKLTDNLQSAVNGDIADKEDNMKRILDEKQQTQGNVEGKKAEWSAIIGQLEDISTEVSDLRSEFYIA